MFPGTDGLIHISELSDKRVKNVTDVLNEGDEVLVKVVSIDKTGKIRLSRKEAMAERAAAQQQAATPPVGSRFARAHAAGREGLVSAARPGGGSSSRPPRASRPECLLQAVPQP